MNSRFVFRFVLTVSSVETTYWMTTRGFRTTASDDPPLQYIAERVTKAGGYSRSLWGSGDQARAAGGVAPSYGVITLANVDGELDEMAAAAPGGTAVCWFGDDSMAFSDYTQVYAARVHSVLADFDSVHIRLRDRLQDLDKPILTATFAGTGGLEGPPGLQTRKKPLVFGAPGMVPLISIDHLRQVYYVQANATALGLYSGGSSFGHPFEGGVPVQHDGSYVFSVDLLGDATAPDAGKYRYWAGYSGDLDINGVVVGSVAAANSYTKGPLYVRLGTPPVLGLRIGAEGLLQNEAGDQPRAWRFTDLCNRAGLSDVWPGALADLGGMEEDFDAGNRYIDGDETYLDVMNDRAAALHGAFGFDRLDRFFCVRLTDPSDGADAVQYAFTMDNATDFARVAASDAERPAWQVSVRAGRAYPDPPAELASAEMRDLLQRDPWLVSFSGSSDAARVAYPGAIAAEVEIVGHHLPDQSAQLDYVTRYGRLYGTRREIIKLRAVDFGSALLALPLHAKVTLTLPRFGLDAGRAMRIVGMEADLDARAITYTLWGGDAGSHYWALTGGSFPAGAGDPGGSGGSIGKPPNWATAIQRPLGAFGVEAYAALQYSVEADALLGDIESTAEISDPPALMFYEGEELSPNESVVGDPLHERTQFLARLDSGVTAEDFEAYSNLQTLVGQVVTHNGVACTITGGGAVCSDDVTHGRFNTTTAGSKWMDCNASAGTPTTLTFAPAISALACYMPDFGDFAGQVSVQLTPSGSTADAEWQLVSLRLDCEGANNSTTVPDLSRYGHTLTASGNAKLSSTSPKYGSTCMVFDGAGDYFSIPYAADLSFNGAEFCIEGWARLDTTVALGLCLIDFRGSGSGSSSWQPFVNASTRSIAIWSGTATVLASASNAVPPMGTWFHWAIERQGTTTKIYIDGAQVSSGTYDPAATNASGIRIGLNQAGTNGWIGAMDDIRFTRRARYGGAFTPPAAALPIEGDPVYDIRHTVNAASGALYFWGLVSTDQTYTQVRFYSSTDDDLFGIDDLYFCTASDVVT